MKVRTRFSPSPTGLIHIGGVYSAMLDYAFAKKHQGKFIIRIEDTDQKRFVKGAEEKIYTGLNWFGFKADESPQVGGPFSPYRQSERLPLYQKYAQKLVDEGKAYYCFCSAERLEENRKQKQKEGKSPMYDRHCLGLEKKEIKSRLEKGESFVLRLKVPEGKTIEVEDLIRGVINFDSRGIDDQVLLKSDGFPTYHLAAVVDDHLMEISHVIRGEEWLSSAPKHVLLYQYLNWKPPLFLHTPTIRDEKKRKLSKREGSASLEFFKTEGYLPEALLNFLCLLGWSHPEEKEIFDFTEFIKVLDLKDVSPVGPIFDLKKLDWLNGVYLRQLADKDLANRLIEFAPKGMSKSLILETVPLIKERISKLSDYSALVDFLAEEVKPDEKLLLQKGGKNEKLIELQLTRVLEKLEKLDQWSSPVLEKTFRQLAESNDWPIGKFFMMIRIAVTGKLITPPLFESLGLLGKKKTCQRLSQTLKMFKGK